MLVIQCLIKTRGHNTTTITTLRIAGKHVIAGPALADLGDVGHITPLNELWGAILAMLTYPGFISRHNMFLCLHSWMISFMNGSDS